MCINNRQRGVTLVELIMFIVIISAALAGILQVMNLTTSHSADPLVRKQALAIAESLLEEIELQDFTKPAGGFAGPYTPANRASFDCVTDYNGFTTTGIFTPGNVAVPGLGSYNINPAVSVAPINVGELGAAVPVASAVRITVTVTDPTGQQTAATGYRTSY